MPSIYRTIYMFHNYLLTVDLHATAKQIANMLQLTDESINGNAWWGKCAVGLHTDKDFAVNINTANIVDYQDKKGKMPISTIFSL